ncbi:MULTISPECIES: hypothetical protein [Vibrio harveyi group]|uniref:hypothetical protein n=1 Tax=Vibrio harveyi group TaxID=717610 RepID=UPI001110737E|nr:hypothetical protein [Vibrio parahaemolyticus]MDG2761598.1 hypothetical protein [Vibrio parahaemolyticus]TMX40849.1 hypothetical protein DA098_03190 [Vibrio parahaemolyticus]TMX79846.1 hypothetical protein DA094_05010 [Vibrio parahaemolyticus]
MISENLKATLIASVKARHSQEAARDALRDASDIATESRKKFESLLYEQPEPDVLVSQLVVIVDDREYHPFLDEENGSLVLEEVTQRKVVIKP